jgi:hypothetical protein
MTLHALAAHGCRTVIAAQSRDAARSRDDRDIDFEIERLLDAFLADELTTPELSHRRQVQVAWVLLRHADFQCALQVFATSMQRRSARAGVEFNVTITTALMNIVAEASVLPRRPTASAIPATRRLALFVAVDFQTCLRWWAARQKRQTWKRTAY